MKRFLNLRFVLTAIGLIALLIVIDFFEGPRLARMSRHILATKAASLSLLASDPFNASYGDPQNGSPRILFIGNSLTGYHDMPGEIAALAILNGYEPYIEKHLNFGKDLKFQFEQPAILKALKEHKWDYVVLQEYSDYPLVKGPQFAADVMEFAPLIKEAGAKIVLFENWPYKGSELSDVQKLNAAYAAVAQEVHGDVVPIANAHSYAAHHSGINMYMDEKHPTPIATYLGASEFVRYFFNVPAGKNLRPGQKLPSIYGLDKTPWSDFKTVWDAVDAN